MKYKYWDEYTDSYKLQICLKESRLETNNATTKADLINMIKFMAQILDENVVEELEQEWQEYAEKGSIFAE